MTSFFCSHTIGQAFKAQFASTAMAIVLAILCKGLLPVCFCTDPRWFSTYSCFQVESCKLSAPKQLMPSPAAQT